MVNINSLAGFKAKKEVENVHQILSNICQTKTKLSCIISYNQRDTVGQTDVKNKLRILHTIIMVKTRINFKYDKGPSPVRNNF